MHQLGSCLTRPEHDHLHCGRCGRWRPDPLPDREQNVTGAEHGEHSEHGRARHGRQRRVLAGNQEHGQHGECDACAEGGRADADDLGKAAPLLLALVQAGQQARNRRKDADG